MRRHYPERPDFDMNYIPGSGIRRISIDDAVRKVASSEGKISVQKLREIVADLAGNESEILSDKDLNNCEN